MLVKIDLIEISPLSLGSFALTEGVSGDTSLWLLSTAMAVPCDAFHRNPWYTLSYTQVTNEWYRNQITVCQFKELGSHSYILFWQMRAEYSIQCCSWHSNETTHHVMSRPLIAHSAIMNKDPSIPPPPPIGYWWMHNLPINTGMSYMHNPLLQSFAFV